VVGAVDQVRCDSVRERARWLGMLVVVLDKLIEPMAELALIPDQGPVEEFVADRSDLSLSEGVCL